MRAYALLFSRKHRIGFAPTLPLCLNPALTLLLFQLIRRLCLPFSHPGRSTGHLRAFADGAFANALAIAALYPLLLAKVRVQAWRRSADVSDAKEDPTMLGVWRAACQDPERGWKGLYDGLAVQILKGFVNQGVTMMVKQRCVRRSAVVHMLTSTYYLLGLNMQLCACTWRGDDIENQVSLVSPGDCVIRIHSSTQAPQLFSL